MAERVQSYKTRPLVAVSFLQIPVLLVNLLNSIRHVWMSQTPHLRSR